MNFCVCRNCNHCKYRGKNGWTTYCDKAHKNTAEVENCPIEMVDRDEFGNEVK
jgi:hypothetical protein